jgi:hypothetical protein
MGTARRYTDAVFASFTKTTQDGRKVIYPWGIWGRGYFIASDKDEEQLKRLCAVSVAVVPILLGAAYHLGGLVGGLGVLILGLVGYAIYVKRLAAGMEPAGERLSWLQATRAGARTYSPRQLWSWVFCGIFLIILGVFAIVTGYPGAISPELGNLPELGIFFGFGTLAAAVGGLMLFLRRGVDRSATAPLPAKSPVIAEEVGSYFTGQMGPVRAWFLTIFGLVLTGIGIFLFVVDPAERSRETVALIALFGAIAAWGMAELVLRHRERHG